MRIRSAFAAYAAEELPDADAETRRVAEEAFYAGALVVLRQAEDPSKSFAAQRRKLRSLATEIYEFSARMAGRSREAAE